MFSSSNFQVQLSASTFSKANQQKGVPQIIIYVLITIIIMLPNQSLDEIYNLHSQQSKQYLTDIFHALLCFSQKQKNLLLIQQTSCSATFKEPNHSQLVEGDYRLLLLQIKANCLQLKCLSRLNKARSKSLENFLVTSLQKLNRDKKTQVFGAKAYFDSSNNFIIIESQIQKDIMNQMSKRQIIFRFQKMLSQLFEISSSFSQSIYDQVSQIEAKLKYELAKCREVFQENRIRRQKATKICLLSKNKSNLINKIVMNYMEDIRGSTQLSRQLYAKYRQKKGQNGKQYGEYITNLNKLWEKRKSQESGNNNLSQEQKLEEKKSVSSYIVQPINVLGMQKQQILEPGGFGEVSKYKCTFKELYTFYYESQIRIEKHIKEQNLEEDEKFIKNEYLIKKKPMKNQHAINSFQNQLICLNLLRHERCPQIAQYYNLISRFKEERTFDEEFLQSEFLHSKYYEISFDQYQYSDHKTKLKILQNLAQGIKFLVDFGIVHRDLKPSNIRLTKSKGVKIIDFGSGCLEYGREIQNKNQRRTRFCFSPDYTLQYAKARLTHISQEEFCRHKFYDLYAYGTIAMNYVGVNKGDPGFLAESMEYLCGKCRQYNPEDRLEPIQVLLYLRELLKLVSLS